MTFKRYAIYYTPPAGAFAGAGAAWLGWDLAAGCPVGAPDDRITGRPRRYGFHGTIKPPFHLSRETEAEGLQAEFVSLCTRLRPAHTGGLEIGRLGRFLALAPGGDTESLVDLAATVVRDLDGFRAPPSDEELEKRRKSRLSGRQEANLSRWGYPYVLADFRFHMTLTGPLPDAEIAAVSRAAQTRFNGLLPDPFVVDSLTLVAEDAAGMFHEVRRCQLGGSDPN